MLIKLSITRVMILRDEFTTMRSNSSQVPKLHCEVFIFNSITLKHSHTTIYVLNNNKKYHKFSSVNCHFCSRENLSLTAWAC